MTDVLHRTHTDSDLHVASFVQSTDPGAVGAGKQWVDTSLGTGLWQLKTRNAANTGWKATPSGGVAPDMNVARAYSSVAFSIPNTGVYYNWDTVLEDPDNTITVGSGTWKWTAPYDCFIIARANWLRQTSGATYLYWRKNGTNIRYHRNQNAYDSWVGVIDTLVYTFAEDEYLQVWAAGSNTANNHPDYGFFNIFYMAV